MHDKIHNSAERMARYFSSRVRHADFDDCYQEAWLALLASLPNYDSTKGAWGPWAASVSARHLRSYLYALKSPVSGPRSRASSTLSPFTSVSLDVQPFREEGTSAHSALVLATAKRAVRNAVEDVLSSVEPSRRRASRAVLLDGLRPREAAQITGLDPKAVSWAVRRVRGAVKARHSAQLRHHL